MTEGVPGTKSVTLKVQLVGPTNRTVTFAYSTFDAIAVAPTDYASAAGTITIPAVATTASIVIAINGDSANEPDEVIGVSVHNATNATVGGFYGPGSITIVNDDS